MHRRPAHRRVIPLLSLTILTTGHPSFATALLVPAYFEPGPYWTELTTAASAGAPITAIMNPSNGPGTAADASYTAAVNSFELAGGKVLGYVYTSDAKRSLSTVEADIKSYESFYPVQGFFLDEMTNDTKSSHLKYYQSLYNFIKGQNATYDVVGNPGTTAPSNYAAVTDTLVTYENVGSSYAGTAPVTWSGGQPASRFANIAYEVPDAATMFADLAQAQAQNVGSVYFTDDGADGNPYDSLPSYFAAEAGAVPEPAAAVFLVAIPLLLQRRRRSQSTR